MTRKAYDTFYEVIVLGAGMVGASVACALGQAGMRVALVDSAFPSSYVPSSVPDVRVSAISPASADFLRGLGVWSAIEAARCCSYRELAVWEELTTPPPFRSFSARRWNRTLFDSREAGVDSLGYIVENHIIQQALHQVLSCLDNVDVLIPAVARRVSRDARQVSVRLGENTELVGRLVVGADGAGSFVRRESGIGAFSMSYQQRALVATVSLASAPPDRTWQAFRATGPLAFLPLASSGGTSYASLVWYDLPESVSRLVALAPTAFLDAVRQAFPEELPDMTGLVERRSFPLACSHAHHYVRQGVVLVGDAAHTINPLAGQGANLGFQDAVTLARILERGWRQGRDIACVSLLEEYEKLCRPRNLLMQAIMDGLYRLFSNDALSLKVVRNLGLAVAGRFPAGRRQVMRYAMGDEFELRLPGFGSSPHFRE